MFYQSELTKKAFDIVTKEFDGVKDKGGKPYIGHLMRANLFLLLTVYHWVVVKLLRS